MEFASQRFAERASGEVHQTNGAPTATDAQEVPGRELADNLAVGAQDSLGLFTNNPDFNPGSAWQYEAAIGQGVRADGSEFEHFGSGEDHGATRGQRIGR